ncbi:MAG: hypothetical protein LH479_04805 [Polaromonas sp.]|nr:hypothetical protein [Polaromonas sp.]
MHRLSFVPSGLDARHRLSASVSPERAPSSPIAQTEASGDADVVRLNLGRLEPDAA